MAAEPTHLLVDCPPSRNDGGGGGGGGGVMQSRQWRIACSLAVTVLVVGAVVTGLTFLGIFLDRRFPDKDPVFRVAVTGVTGLDTADLVEPPRERERKRDVHPQPADYYDDVYGGISSPPPPRPPPPPPPPPPSPSPAALSPVFDLTFQIDNTRNGNEKACLPGLSRAEVSYGDAFLASASVPPFCAGTLRTSGPVAVRAWGDRVAVPRFLREQLAAELAAGDAAVDVKVTMTRYCRPLKCGGAVFTCKAKIGGGTSSTACRLDFL